MWPEGVTLCTLMCTYVNFWTFLALVYDTPPTYTPLSWPLVPPEETCEGPLIEGSSRHFSLLVLGKRLLILPQFLHLFHPLSNLSGSF